MTTFVRLLEVGIDEKAAALGRAIHDIALIETTGEAQASAATRIFEREPVAFEDVPGSPFAYWVGDLILGLFKNFPSFQSAERVAASGGKTLDDFRFIRTSWEVGISSTWPGFAKGGSYAPFYSDIYLRLFWHEDARALKAYLVDYRSSRGWSPNWTAELHSSEHYFRPGLTWPLRTQSGLGMRAMAAGCIFGHKGPAAFVQNNRLDDLLTLLSITTSTGFRYLVELQTAFGSYEVGVIQRTPIPTLSDSARQILATLARRAWSQKRTLDTTNETSHAFLLPPSLRSRLSIFESVAIHRDIDTIQSDIDEFAFRLYGIEGHDRAEIERWASKRGKTSGPGDDESQGTDADDDESDAQSAGDRDTLLSWCVGVAFGRFDIRLATGERAAPPEPEPFDPLPQRSPGMMQDDSAVRSILTDDEGHADDLTAAVRDVLTRVQMPEPEGLRAWLARDFFPLHIQMYSKSRRKAPIYWQLATPSASYSVWLYIHAFSKDTLYKVQNDHVAAKLAHEERKLESLRADLGAAPKAADRKLLAAQESLVEELRAFLEEVKRVAPLWNPDLDDGVILNFAPLWRLVPHHKPWQKELKTTWEALASGPYDWAHLAMHLWPERVVPKCATDRSLAIAHDLEDVFWEEGPDGKWKPRPAPTHSIDDLVRDRTSPAVKAALKSLTEAPTAAGTAKRTRKGKAHA